MKSIKNKLKTGQIEMKGYPNSSGVISFNAEAKKITIDWGDGYIDEITSNGVEDIISHQYPNNNFQTILINAENLTYIGSLPPDLEADYLGDRTIITKYSELRFGDCSNLEQIKFPYQILIVLDIKKAGALQKLYCECNELTELNVSGCTALRKLYCENNHKLSKLNVSGCTELRELYCGGNELTELNLSGYKELRKLYCAGNLLTKLNLSGYKKLQELQCAVNQITELIFDGCTSLKELYCFNNKMIELNISMCTALELLLCHNNQLTVEKLNKLFESLQTISIKEGLIVIEDNPGSSTCNKSIATKKGWSVKKLWDI